MVLIVMSSCSDPSASPVPSNPRWQDTTPPQTDNTDETDVTPQPSDDGKKYVFPEVRIAEYHEELTEGFENARIDISSIKEGYVAASAKSENRLKFQVKKEGITYNYDLPSDGTPGIFPSYRIQFHIVRHRSRDRPVIPHLSVPGTPCS